MHPKLPPDPVRRPVVLQRWESLTFVHWRVEPAVVQAVLPPGLTVDTFDGSAWVGLVPFRMVGVRPPLLPAIPWLTTFPETNIRTYVKDAQGGNGVWFSSLEITRLLGVGFARAVFGVPYTWSNMRMSIDGRRVSYESRRRWPAPRGATSRLVIDRDVPVEADPLVAFLTNRWRAYTRLFGRLAFAPVAHEPWQLESARIVDLQDRLSVAACYPGPSGELLVHHAPGVTARVGRPRLP